MARSLPSSVLSTCIIVIIIINVPRLGTPDSLSVSVSSLGPQSPGFMSCAWKWVKTNYAARRPSWEFLILFFRCSVQVELIDSTSRMESGSDYDVSAAKKISISGNNFEALIMAVKYEGGSDGVLPKNCHKVEQCRRNVPAPIGIGAGWWYLNRTQKGSARDKYGNRQPYISSLVQ